MDNFAAIIKFVSWKTESCERGASLILVNQIGDLGFNQIQKKLINHQRISC